MPNGLVLKKNEEEENVDESFEYETHEKFEDSAIKCAAMLLFVHLIGGIHIMNDI